MIMDNDKTTTTPEPSELAADSALSASPGSVSSAERMFSRDMAKTGNWKQRQEIGTLTLQLMQAMEAADTQCDEADYVEMLRALVEAKRYADRLFEKVRFYLPNK